jgi:type IV pilus assembly protein PilC
MNNPVQKPAQKINTKNVSISGNEKISLISNLTTMLAAGIPILETIDSLSEDSKGNMKKLLDTLREDLMQGQPVHESFAKFPKIFDKVTVNIIRASEEAGTLDVTLKDLKDNIKKEMEFNDKIKSALIYPLFIVIVFFAVLLMILVVVIPKISTVFLRLHVTLPLPTRILIFMSNALLQNTIPVVLGITLLVVGIVLLFKREKKRVVQLLTMLPLVSNLAKEIDMTHFARSLYLLLNAGIPITSALELTHEVVTNKDVASAITHARDVVSSGRKLSEAFHEEKKVIPTMIIKMTEAGEKSGSLDKSMQEAAEFLDYQVSGMLKTATSLIEPIMLVVVGGLVGGMMLAIIAPIYGLIGQVGPK